MFKSQIKDKAYATCLAFGHAGSRRQRRYFLTRMSESGEIIQFCADSLLAKVNMIGATKSS